MTSNNRSYVKINFTTANCVCILACPTPAPRRMGLPATQAPLLTLYPVYIRHCRAMSAGRHSGSLQSLADPWTQCALNGQHNNICLLNSVVHYSRSACYIVSQKKTYRLQRFLYCYRAPTFQYTQNAILL